MTSRRERRRPSKQGHPRYAAAVSPLSAALCFISLSHVTLLFTAVSAPDSTTYNNVCYIQCESKLNTRGLALARVRTYADLDIWPFDLKYGSWSWFRNSGTGSWFGLPTKHNRLVRGPRPTPPKHFVEISSQLADIRCKMFVYVPIPNGKESWKMIQDSRRNPDRHQKQWVPRTGCPAKFGDAMSSGFSVIVLTHTPTHP